MYIRPLAGGAGGTILSPPLLASLVHAVLKHTTYVASLMPVMYDEVKLDEVRVMFPRCLNPLDFPTP